MAASTCGQVSANEGPFLIMSEPPTDLDGRRSPRNRRLVTLRRQAANDPAASVDVEVDERLEAALLAEPARTWVDAMTKARFLLERFAATPEADDVRIRTLIKRVLGDMARLNNRGDRRK
jgi:hypothetical protein